MKDVSVILNKILENNADINKELVRKVLILFEEEVFYLGDTCLEFDELRICKLFFRNAAITINCGNKAYMELYRCLLKNNPYLNTATCDDWEDVRFEDYDVIVCISNEEEALLSFITEKYGQRICNDELKMRIFSITEYFIDKDAFKKIVFPVYKDLFDYARGFFGNRPAEIFISSEEKAWANQWLRNNGLKEGEQLYIVLDSSARRRKLLRMDVYYDLLMFLLQKDDVKVLVFDEKDVGKESFYKELIEERFFRKIIFSKKLGLRNDLCLMGSDYTRLVIGPCTGLLHCISGIYNHYVAEGMPLEKVPLMITYTGNYTEDKETAHQWWGNSPLINCLVLKEVNQQKKAVLLSDMSEEEKLSVKGVLPCDEYSADLIIDFINSKTPHYSL